MASGTQPLVDLAATPTFSALLQASVRIGLDAYHLHLYQEKRGKEFEYYALVNGQRIRPLCDNARSNHQAAEVWFNGMLELYVSARANTQGPFD